MSKFCAKCGTELNDEDLFCSKCGTMLSSLESNKSVESRDTVLNKPKNNIKIFIITLIVTLVAIGLVGVIASLFDADRNTKSLPTNVETEEIENYDDVTVMTLSSYVSQYNCALRRTIDGVEVSYGVSDEKYISCAKTFINSKLKNPSSATYNSAKVYEKDSYGKAIVSLDVSSQNGFGGWVRETYYVCILSVDDDGTFHYSTTMPYIESTNMSLYETFKNINDFGSHPADDKVKDLLIDKNDFHFSRTINRTDSKLLDVYECYTELAIHNVYIDPQTDKIVTVQLNFPSVYPNEKIEKICNAMYDTMLTKDMSMQIDKFISGTAFEIYEEGIVCDCSVSANNVNIAATATRKDSYESGEYWTPNKMNQSNNDTASEEADNNNSVSEMDDNTIQAILNGKMSFIDFDSKLEATITSLPQVNSQYMGEPGMYAVVDLDNNGTKELLIEYNFNGDTAIINIQNGKCIAYYIPYRGRTGLKTDGTMSWSSGASESGVQRISFGNEGIISTDIIVYSEGLFAVNGNNVTKEKCEKALSEQDMKKDVEWLPIS